VLKSYGVHEVTGDRYAGEWPRERFNQRGITYEPAEKPESAIYQEFLAVINSGRCELLDHPRMIGQLCSLERRTARGGRDSIDHPPGAHDDIANAAVGVLVQVAGEMDEIACGFEVVNAKSAAWPLLMFLPPIDLCPTE
jgi:hypothetical protein